MRSPSRTFEIFRHQLFGFPARLCNWSKQTSLNVQQPVNFRYLFHGLSDSSSQSNCQKTIPTPVGEDGRVTNARELHVCDLSPPFHEFTKKRFGQMKAFFDETSPKVSYPFLHTRNRKKLDKIKEVR